MLCLDANRKHSSSVRPQYTNARPWVKAGCSACTNNVVIKACFKLIFCLCYCVCTLFVIKEVFLGSYCVKSS